MSIPYMPLYVSDYEADTAHLTMEEDGAYNRLLRLCWRTPGCSVPNDEEWIFRRMRATDANAKSAIRSVIQEFFRTEKGRLFQGRQISEWHRINETSQKRSEAGKKGGRPAKPLENNNSGKSPAKAKRKQPELEPELDNKPPKSPKGECAYFSEFWAAYPPCKRKTDKPKARVLFAKIIAGKHPQIDQTQPDQIISGVKAFAATNPDQEFIPLPTTWLNGERWTVSHLPTAKKYGNYI